MNNSSFFCENLRKYDAALISPSVSLGFYLRDKKEVIDFYEQMQILNSNFDEMSFLGVMKITPDYFLHNYEEKEEKEEECLEKDMDVDDDWDIIKWVYYKI